MPDELVAESSLGDGDSDTVIVEADTEETKPLTTPPSPQKGLVDRMVDSLRKPETVDALMGKEESGFKAFAGADGKARWIGWYSNAFKDKDGEYFPTKAIDAYVARVDMGIVPYPELWIDHVPGSKAGKADWVGRIGLISVAVGTFDDTEIGRVAHQHYATERKARRMSHGFEYDARRKRDNAYWVFNTFEVSTLPIGREANPFTSFGGIKAMPIADWKEEDLKSILGDDLAKRVLDQTEAQSKALVNKNLAWKEFTDPVAANADIVVSQKAVDSASSDLKAFIPDILETQTSILDDQTATIKMLKAQQDEIVVLRGQVKVVLKEVADIKGDRPRSASKDADTVVSSDSPLVEQLVTRELNTPDPFLYPVSK